MTDLRKAAEMALEVMEYNRANGTPNMGAAIEALRQALANEFNPDWNQVEALQESLREHMAEIQRLRQALAQPEQEPVAWMHKEKGKPLEFYMPDEGEDCENCEHCIPLYTAPPKREWQGLTDEEGAEIWGDAHDLDWKRTVTPKEIVKRIEAKLKEKNT